MNKKIETLLRKLQKECEQEGVTVVCTLQKDGKVATALVGNLPNVACCLAIQERELDKNLPIPTSILRSAALDALGEGEKERSPRHTFVVDDWNDVPDILARILRGDYK